jgi:hypothetical protein
MLPDLQKEGHRYLPALISLGRFIAVLEAEAEQETPHSAGPHFIT